MEIKPAVFLKGSRKAIREFPEQARKDAGHELRAVQKGSSPGDWRSIPAVGLGAVEIRLHNPHEHRVIYVAKFNEAVYVLHAFEKKEKATSKQDINIGRAAYAQMQTIHREKKQDV